MIGDPNWQPRIKKFDRNLRTFETRLLFIHELFTHKKDNLEIMTSSIQYKLDRSFERYWEQLIKSENFLSKRDPIRTLRSIKKKEEK